jgi:hypothetical protein
MFEEKKNMKIIKAFTILGNILFVLFLLYNGIDEGFKATPLESIVIPILIVLLLFNIYFIKKHYFDV